MNPQFLDAAKLMVSKAVSYYKGQGKEKALTEFSNPKGLFREDDIYIFVMSLDGVIIAHGVDDKLVGRDLTAMADSDGRGYFHEIIETANLQGSGFAKYWWPNPSSQHIEPKEIYFEKIDDIIICSGVYN
ncbi:MAG: cache domain-containing protein [Syntrophales bacterium LBB04]|nr:cache domain-containing protein [Syntrophales bacterium LBB04]